MQNEEELKIKSNNKIIFSPLSTKIYNKLNKILSFQVINILFIVILYFTIYMIRKKENIS